MKNKHNKTFVFLRKVFDIIIKVELNLCKLNTRFCDFSGIIKAYSTVAYK